MVVMPRIVRVIIRVESLHQLNRIHLFTVESLSLNTTVISFMKQSTLHMGFFLA